MKKEGSVRKYSATDLSNHLNCSFITKLELQRLDERVKQNHYTDPFVEVLQKKGLDFEKNYLKQKLDESKNVYEITNESTSKTNDGRINLCSTITEAINQRADIIYQAKLSHDNFGGISDFIEKNENGIYEVVDTKLTDNTKAGTLIQIQLYADILKNEHDIESDITHVQKYSGERESYRVDDVREYYEVIKSDFLETVKQYEIDSSQKKANEVVYDVSPDPVEHCMLCKWRSHCEKNRRDNSHLSLVAGIRKTQVKLLRDNGKDRYVSLKDLNADDIECKNQKIKEGLEKVIKQANLQLEYEEQLKTNSNAIPKPHLLDTEELRGLKALPDKHEDDIYLDFEGDPFIGDDGMEYLTGWIHNNTYHKIWATNNSEEESAFINMMNFVKDKCFPEEPNIDDKIAGIKEVEEIVEGSTEQHHNAVNEDISEQVEVRNDSDEKNTTDKYIEEVINYEGPHIYIYTSYEKAAIKRLIYKYQMGSRLYYLLEQNKVFVDLYYILTHSIQLGLPSYSLKEIETYTEYNRQVSLDKVRPAKNAIEHILEMGSEGINSLHDILGNSSKEDALTIVEQYNEDDCKSTKKLHDKLEELFNHNSFNRPIWKRIVKNIDYLEEENSSDRNNKKRELKKRVNELIPKLKEKNIDQLSLLANALDYFYREESADNWKYLNEIDYGSLEYFESDEYLVYPTQVGDISKYDRSKKLVLSFPIQPMHFNVGDELKGIEMMNKFGKIVEVSVSEDQTTNEGTRFQDTITIALKISNNLVNEENQLKDPLPMILDIYEEKIDFSNKVAILCDISEWMIDNIDETNNDRLFEPARKLLHKIEPAFTDAVEYQDTLSALLSNYQTNQSDNYASDKLNLTAKYLDKSCLAVQGPPGTGKSYCIKKLVISLLKEKKDCIIGITALSHAVLNEMAHSIYEESCQQNVVEVKIGQATKKGSEESLKDCGNNTWYQKPDFKSNGEYNIVVGTTYFFSSKDKHKVEGNYIEYDYIIIEEAGQLSIVDTLVVTSMAKNVIMVGDPQQLQQPQKRKHHFGAEVSGLRHFMGDGQTIEETMGIFIDKTRRMHPDICNFVSTMYYDKKLTPIDGLEQRRINCIADDKYSGSGLRYVKVEHQMECSTSSNEEIYKIRSIITQLLDGQTTFIDKNSSHIITPKDILIITPFNNQKDRIKKMLIDLEAENIKDIEHDGQLLSTYLQNLDQIIEEKNAAVNNCIKELKKVQKKLESSSSEKNIKASTNSKSILEGKIAELNNELTEEQKKYSDILGEYRNKFTSTIQVGTVDSFQGRQAPIVLYSTVSTDATVVPRGMDFLYNPNRFNVAVSRAMAMFIMVGSPKLFYVQCKRPEQVKLVNAFCLFRKLATEIE